MRADLFLVECGTAATRSQAQRLIASGVQWRSSEVSPWKTIVKNGDEIPPLAELLVLDAAEARYLSRGGLKLEGALKATGVDVSGLHCLDIGQSTGGFTDCLLQHGAAQVTGVDVGHGQLHPRLREDSRVQCIEGINARSLTAIDLIAARAGVHWPEGTFDAENEAKNSDFGDSEAFLDGSDAAPLLFGFLCADVSFISLTLVLPAVVRFLAPGAHALLLIKPQFELQPGQIGKGGIVKEAAHFAFVEERLRTACTALGLEVQAWLDSPIDGGDGNREFFIHAIHSLQPALASDAAPLLVAASKKPLRAPRVSRTAQRALREAHLDPEAAHAGQPGPARSKNKLRGDSE